MIRTILQGITRNYCETAPNSRDRRLRGRFYRAVPEVVFRAAERIAGQLEGWRLVSSAPEIGDLAAECRTSVLGVVDDFEIAIRDTGEGRTSVNVRSAARRGRGDFGRNARNVDRFLAALDGKLK